MERNCEPMNKNRIEGAAEQGERAKNREALVVKAKGRRSGGCAGRECVLTWGNLASCLKGRRRKPEREVLQPLIDPTLCEHSHGFRPGRRARDAVLSAQQQVQRGYRVGVNVDLSKFFDWAS